MTDSIAEFFTSLDTAGIIIQIIGFFGTAAFFVGFQQKQKKKIIFFQMIGISFFTLHFFLLGGYTGAVMNLFGLLRAWVFYNADTKKWARSKWWFWGLMTVYTVVGILTWQDIYSLLPLCAMLLSTYGFTKDDPTLFRLYNFPCSPMWLVYNLHVVSVSGAITECFTMTSMIIAFIKYDIIGKYKDRKAKEKQG